MHLKSIDLQGFKSFVDKTHIELQGGISCIVGPNGSGKSNISDAVRWVMGEQSARSLRGQKMEDIIFAGSVARKQVGMAEVSLTLDNNDGGLGVEFAEVCVTRRAYRNGDSEYLINGEQCRLKDIQSLFVDTGLGNDGLSLIGQGRVGQIVDMKAEERRSLIEEAAGIVRYRNRKKTAMRKLQDTQANLERLGDIVAELGARVQPLGKQAAKAQQYLTLNGQADKLEINLILQVLQQSKEKLATLDEKIAQQTQQQIAAETQKSTVGAHLEQQKAVLAAAEETYQHANRSTYELAGLRQAAQARQQVAAANLAAVEQNIVRIGQELELLNSRDDGFMQHLESLVRQKEQMSAELSAARTVLQQAVSENEHLREQAEEREQQLTLRREEAYDRAGELVNLRNELTHRRQEVAQTIAHLEELLASLTRGEQELAATLTERDELRQRLAAADSEHKQGQGKLAALNQRQDELQSKVQTAAEQEVEARYKLNSLQSRLHMLKEMQVSYEGYYPGVKAILQAKKQGNAQLAGIVGVVADLLQVENTYRVAVEAALGGAMQHVVTQDGKGARQAVAFLKERRAGRATFLPTEEIRPTSKRALQKVLGENGVIGRCSDVVAIDAAYQNIADFLLGNILLVENLEVAGDLARQSGQELRIVTLEGDMITPGGAITGGSRTKRTTDLLSRKGEIDDLEQQVAALTAKVQKLEKELAVGKAEQAELTASAEEIITAARSYELHKMALSKDFEYAQTALKQKQNSLLFLKNDRAEQQQELGHLQESVARMEQQALGWDEENSSISSELGLLQQQIRQGNALYEEGRQNLEEQRVALARREQELLSLQEDIKRLKGEKQDLFSQDSEKRTQLTEFGEQRAVLTAEMATSENELANLAAQTLNSEAAVTAQNELLQQQRNQLEALDAELREVSRAAMLAQQNIHQLEVARARAAADWDNESARLTEAFEIDYDTAFAQYYDEELDRRDLARTVKELRRNIRDLGNVNVDSIAEYAEVKERFDFLSAQRADLLAAKAALDKVIDEMDRIMTKRFAVSFEAVSAGFNKTFFHLFGGGSAGLLMTDPDDLLNTGVEISVSLPGKRVNNYNLLSGGEKALIGIALLLAVFQVRPSPFCMLDEADAALDEANVDRFAAYLKQYINNTQFLVITHRQGTMEVADNLWGVTMEEEGVSKMVSVRLDDLDLQQTAS